MEETKKTTIEQKASAAILQTPLDIVIGLNKYSVAPPSTATLIMVSEEISKMPYINADPQNLAAESLSIAKDCRPLGDILAILVLGAKYIIGERKVREKHGKWRFLAFWKSNKPTRKDLLAKEILENMSPSAIHKEFVRLLQCMNLGDFFAITTFLSGINLLHPTKVVTETEATVSGH